MTEIQRLLSACGLCPRRCGADRTAGLRGICGAGNEPLIYRVAPHFGEEPPVSGSKGAGNIFFSGCPLKCVYCQNYPWSQQGNGVQYDLKGLKEALLELAAVGCHNWNFVGPSPWLPWIVEAVRQAENDGCSLPVVYNTSGYELVESLRMLEGMNVVYLTDLRYSQNSTALLYSGVNNYVEVARSALLDMMRQVGHLKCDESGLALSGVICRLLVLPGCHGEAIENLEWLAEHRLDGLFVSIMSQYTPAYRSSGFPEIDRPLDGMEYTAVVDRAEQLGFVNGWVQGFDSNPSKELVGYNMKMEKNI